MAERQSRKTNIEITVNHSNSKNPVIQQCFLRRQKNYDCRVMDVLAYIYINE